MIGRLRGRVVERRPPHLLLEVQGVGYELEAPMSTFYALPADDPAAEVLLYTHLVVREDAHLLFGFASESERRLFRALIRVNGVGARLALTILSGMEAGVFTACVQAGDAARLTTLPGVGKKTAERLVVEMRDRLGDWDAAALPVVDPGAAGAPAAPRDAVADAVSGLVALGYKPQEASRYVGALQTEGLSSEDIIREALRGLVRG